MASKIYFRYKNTDYELPYESNTRPRYGGIALRLSSSLLAWLAQTAYESELMFYNDYVYYSSVFHIKRGDYQIATNRQPYAQHTWTYKIIQSGAYMFVRRDNSGSYKDTETGNPVNLSTDNGSNVTSFSKTVVYSGNSFRGSSYNKYAVTTTADINPSGWNHQEAGLSGAFKEKGTYSCSNPVLSGYSFYGWSLTSPTGGTTSSAPSIYSLSSTLSTNTDRTFYAWFKKDITATIAVVVSVSSTVWQNGFIAIESSASTVDVFVFDATLTSWSITTNDSVTYTDSNRTQSNDHLGWYGASVASWSGTVNIAFPDGTTRAVSVSSNEQVSCGAGGNNRQVKTFSSSMTLYI
ncbi:MAG: hypothetical protein K6F15_03985 [Treponema sp.]|nr:hypothetical protein [Treponema sp.]